MESFRLEAISELHPLTTESFIPFVVTRLQTQPDDTESMLTIELRGNNEDTTEEQQLHLIWDNSSIPQSPLAVQDKTLTEWAALGIACVAISEFAGLRLHAVAAAGDGFDYWVKQDTQEFALEISGTVTANLESRHREKVQQLQANPYGTDGYVVVVDFTTRRVIFSFHRFAEN